MQRLFVELVEGTIHELKLIMIPDVGYISTTEAEELEVSTLVAEIQRLGFEGLSRGKWRQVLNIEHRTMLNPLDDIEALIKVHGRYCQINDAKKLLFCTRSLQMINSNFDVDLFHRCLAETAVSQQLDESGIGRTEFQKIRSDSDDQVSHEALEIIEITFNKIVALVRKILGTR